MLINKVCIETKEIIYFEWEDSTCLTISFDCVEFKDLLIVPCFTLLLVSSINYTSEKLGKSNIPSYASRPFTPIQPHDKYTKILINKAFDKIESKNKIKIACEHLIKTK